MRGRSEGERGSGNGSDPSEIEMMMKPAWLVRLMEETFFGSCGVHPNTKKNDKNVLCLHCCLTICSHCLPSHPSHPLLQVRRYVYQNVVRLGDLEKFIDCSNIQPYTLNKAKVIFLKRAQPRSSCQGSSNVCCYCDRILQEPFHFCSLPCKVDHMVRAGESLSNILHLHESDFSFSQFEGLRMDSLEVYDEDTQFAPTSSCSNTEATSHSLTSCLPKVATTTIANNNNNKKTSNGCFLSLGSRRKSAPKRAPLS